MQGSYSPIVRAVFSLLLTQGVVSTTQADNGISTAISGFGTIGGTYTGDSAYTYVHNSSEFKATNGQFDLGLDSRIGVQAIFTYGTQLSVVVLEEAKRRGSENFSLGAEWAYLQYAPADDVKLRLGRVALATFLMSDSRDVGYAQAWFRAPNEVYQTEPFEPSMADRYSGMQAGGRSDSTWQAPMELRVKRNAAALSPARSAQSPRTTSRLP